MLNVAILHKVEKTERRMKRTERKRYKCPEQRIKERDFMLDDRFHVRSVIRNKGRSREKQDLKRVITEEDYE